MGSSPMSGSLLAVQSLLGILPSLPFPYSCALSPSLSLLSQNKKRNFKKILTEAALTLNPEPFPPEQSRDMAQGRVLRGQEGFWHKAYSLGAVSGFP